MIAGKIVHVHFKDTVEDDYFSSIKAVFQYYEPSRIGLQYQSLVNALHDASEHENKRVVVKLGRIKSSTSKQSSCNESN